MDIIDRLTSLNKTHDKHFFLNDKFKIDSPFPPFLKAYFLCNDMSFLTQRWCRLALIEKRSREMQTRYCSLSVIELLKRTLLCFQCFRWSKTITTWTHTTPIIEWLASSSTAENRLSSENEISQLTLVQDFAFACRRIASPPMWSMFDQSVLSSFRAKKDLANKSIALSDVSLSILILFRMKSQFSGQDN